CGCLTAVEVVVRSVGPNDLCRAARIGLHLEEVEQATVTTGSAREPELADRAVVVGVFRDLGRREARAPVGLAVRDGVQRLRHVDVPRALDEARPARFL